MMWLIFVHVKRYLLDGTFCLTFFKLKADSKLIIKKDVKIILNGTNVLFFYIFGGGALQLSFA